MTNLSERCIQATLLGSGVKGRLMHVLESNNNPTQYRTQRKYKAAVHLSKVASFRKFGKRLADVIIGHKDKVKGDGCGVRGP